MTRRLALVLAGAWLAACSDATAPGPLADCSTRPDTAVVAIEDPNLALAIRSALGVSTLLPLTCGLVEGLTVLNASSRGIATVEGIQSLTGLTTLNVRDNAITDVAPLSALTGLASLNLAANAIHDIGPLGALTGLTFLAINDNGAIADIGAVSAMTGLTGTVWLGGNAIESLEALRHLTGLTGVNAWDNRIRDLGPLAALTGLRDVNAHHNLLTSADGLADLPVLRSVSLHHNPHLVDVRALIDNVALVSGTDVNLASTPVSCSDVDALAGKGVSVISDCS